MYPLGGRSCPRGSGNQRDHHLVELRLLGFGDGRREERTAGDEHLVLLLTATLVLLGLHGDSPLAPTTTTVAGADPTAVRPQATVVRSDGPGNHRSPYRLVVTSTITNTAMIRCHADRPVHIELLQASRQIVGHDHPSSLRSEHLSDRIDQRRRGAHRCIARNVTRVPSELVLGNNPWWSIRAPCCKRVGRPDPTAPTRSSDIVERTVIGSSAWSQPFEWQSPARVRSTIPSDT